MKYFSYILYSVKIDQYYTGSTINIIKRLIKHNKGYNKSTKSGIPWMVVYFEEYATRSEAYKREKEIKRHKNREFITKLIRLKVTGPDF
jgi:putative endonuclease